MKRNPGVIRLFGGILSSAIVVAAMAANLAGQAPKQKKFLTGPLTIEDQGSFFIGGVPKVTDYATPPPPGANAAAPTPQQITIGQMYVQFQIPEKKNGSGWPVIM